MKLPARKLLLLGIGLLFPLLAGCSGGGSDSEDTKPAPGPEQPEAMTLIGGDAQTGEVGTAVANDLVVKITSNNGNPSAGVDVSFAVTNGNATLTNAQSQTDNNGLASCGVTFGSTPGTVTIQATTGLALSGEPAVFNLTATHGAPASLTYITEPRHANPGATLSPAFELEVRDTFGNLCTQTTSAVSVSLAAGTGTSGAGLSGTTTRNTQAGVVSFDDLSVNLSGSGYRLAAVVGSVGPELSSPFDIDDRAQLAFGTVPSTSEQVDVTWSFFSVEIRDAAGAVVSSDNSTQVDASLFTGSGTLSGTLSVTAENGVCVFEMLNYDVAEVITVEFNPVAGFGTPLSVQLNVESGPSANLPISTADVNNSGTDGNDQPFDEAISADGRFIAFASRATNLVAGDTNFTDDVFVHDRLTNTTERVSVGPGGVQSNGNSRHVSISANGRFVSFRSDATNLVANDTNGARDIFVHDRQTGVTRVVSIDSNGTQSNSASQDSALSANGRFVAFRSSATNLVANDTNGARDIFVHDLLTGETERVSVDSNGNQGDSHCKYPALSADGRFVVFESKATNLAAGDTNGLTDVFVHDRESGTTERVSVNSSGAESDGDCTNASISADGRYVAFQTGATNFASNRVAAIDVYVHDRQTAQTDRVSNSVITQGAGGSYQSEAPTISADGRYVTYFSFAEDLVANDTNYDWDVFLYDRTTGTTIRLSESASGTQSNGMSIYPKISADGRYVVFNSMATNLANTTNSTFHSYVAPTS